MRTDARFGDWLREKRQIAGFTQRELAELLGVDPTYVVKIETGVVKLPRYDLRARVHQILGTTEAELYQRGVIPDLLEPVSPRPQGVDSVEEEPDDDPFLSVVMSGAKTLTPLGRRRLARYLRLLQDEEREDANELGDPADLAGSD